MNSRASGRRHTRRHHAFRLNALPKVVVLSLVALGMVGPMAAQRATAGDPAATYQKWRDDEIFVPLPASGGLQSTSYEYNLADNTLSQPLPYCDAIPSTSQQMAAAAGRIMSPYSDQVAVAYVNSSANIEVRFADQCNLANPTVSTGPAAILGAASGMPALVVPWVTGLAWPYDMASADLDKRADAGSNYRDEVVVAYATPSSNPDNLTVTVAVLDYSMDASAPTITWTTAGSIYKWTLSAWAGRDVPVMPLSLVTGDFDGDGHKEIAIAYLMHWHAVGITVLRYTSTEANGVVTHSVNAVSPLAFEMDLPSDLSEPGYEGTIDAAAGDFDGDGKDELAVAAIELGSKSNTPRIAVDLKTFKADASLAMAQASTAFPYEDSSNGDAFVSGVQLAAGLFKFVPNSLDPTQDFNINRRQLALATNGSSGAVDLRTLVYDTLLKPTLATADAYQRIPASGSPPGRLNFQMAAGGFNGLQTTDSPAAMVTSLAFTTWANNGQVLYLFDPDPNTGKLGTPHFTQTLSATPNTVKSTSIAPLVAYDYGKEPTGTQQPEVLYGDSQYLGAPLYFRIEDVIMEDYILQEPPKHVFWNADDKTITSCPVQTVCNVSAQDTFTLGTKDSLSLGMTSEYHDTFDYSIGVSETGSLAFSKGISILPPTRQVTLSETVGGEFNDHVDEYSKDLTQRTVSLEQVATRDDAIKYRVQGIDVWRYPVFGVNLDMPYAYFDITGPSPNPQTYLSGGIDASDWYQPVHENGNILSYPLPVGDSYTPTDMGSFQVPCTDVSGKTCDKDSEGQVLSSKTITGPLLDSPTGFTWSGTAPTVELVDSRSETKGKTHSWSRSLKTSEEIKATGTVRLKVLPTGWKMNTSIDASFSGKWSWGAAHTMEMKSDSVSSIKLSVPAGVPSQAYNVYPSFYVSQNGATKVAFAVDTETLAGHTFWDNRYYAKPDPALNLPLRFNPGTAYNATVWTPNMEDSRKLMRGFYVLRSEADESGDYPPYAGPPIVGDLVRLEARVHNFSLGQTVPAGMKVRFDAVPIDPGTRRVEEENRTEIATTTVGAIGPRGTTTAVVHWDTSQIDLGGFLEGNFRIYVMLDPDNAVPNEKYETESAASRTYPIADCGDPADLPTYCIDPGQNNEGWREVKVMADYAGDPRFGTPGDVHLRKDALAARDPSDPSVLLTETVQAEEGQRLQLRVKIDTDVLGTGYGHLLLYDGAPEKGGKLIAHKQAFTGNPEGSYVWVEWTPKELGPHRIYAKVLESSDDTQTGNAVDDLMVVVHKAKTKRSR